MPSVSVVIPVYNAEVFLRETLESVREQTFSDLEIICVDDCSRDSSCAIVESYDGIRLIRRATNSGLASAPRNEGIRAARGEFVAVCDADDVLLPGKIAAQVELLRRHPHIDFCFTDFADFDDTGQRPSHLRSCVELLQATGPRSPDHSYLLDSRTALRVLVAENYVGASTMLFRRSLIEKIGFFREDLRGSEDIDFVFRAAAAGGLGFVDMLGHLRRLHATNVSHNHARMLTSRCQVLRDRYRIAEDKLERRRLRAGISSAYESLAYVQRKAHNRQSSLHMALLAVKWDAARLTAYREVLKAAVTRWVPVGHSVAKSRP